METISSRPTVCGREAGYTLHHSLYGYFLQLEISDISLMKFKVPLWTLTHFFCVVPGTTWSQWWAEWWLLTDQQQKNSIVCNGKASDNKLPHSAALLSITMSNTKLVSEHICCLEIQSLTVNKVFNWALITSYLKHEAILGFIKITVFISIFLAPSIAIAINDRSKPHKHQQNDYISLLIVIVI